MVVVAAVVLFVWESLCVFWGRGNKKCGNMGNLRFLSAYCMSGGY